MAETIALNLRKRIRHLNKEILNNPIQRKIVIEEHILFNDVTPTHAYQISVEDASNKFAPLAFVNVQRKGWIFGYYQIVDTSKNGWDDVIDCASEIDEANTKAYNRAVKIANLISRQTGLEKIDYRMHHRYNRFFKNAKKKN